MSTIQRLVCLIYWMKQHTVYCKIFVVYYAQSTGSSSFNFVLYSIWPAFPLSDLRHQRLLAWDPMSVDPDLAKNSHLWVQFFPKHLLFLDPRESKPSLGSIFVCQSARTTPNHTCRIQHPGVMRPSNEWSITSGREYLRKSRMNEGDVGWFSVKRP